MVQWEQQCSELLIDYSALLCYYSYQPATDVLIKEPGWKQTEFEMWPIFDNTLPSCIFHNTLPTSFVYIRVKLLKLDSSSVVKCARRVWGEKVNKPFSLSARVRISSLVQCLPFITTGVAHQIISQYIGTGTVATSQPADVRLPFSSWTFAICSAAHRLVVSIPCLLVVFES